MNSTVVYLEILDDDKCIEYPLTCETVELENFLDENLEIDTEIACQAGYETISKDRECDYILHFFGGAQIFYKVPYSKKNDVMEKLGNISKYNKYSNCYAPKPNRSRLR